jgi:hypothetical protein
MPRKSLAGSDSRSSYDEEDHVPRSGSRHHLLRCGAGDLMEWYQIFAIVMLTISGIEAIWKSESCLTLLIQMALLATWIAALNAGNFFA